jgi:NMD protein affecting ribosome stability and mRNA decay
VLLALLICTDGDCALHYEAIGIPEELECLVCDSCGCALQAISWAEAAPNGARPAPLHLQLLGAA